MEKIRIEKRFKQDLDDRFNPEKAEGLAFFYIINNDCPLCIEYKNCKDCPFVKFAENGKSGNGCVLWINRLLKSPRIFTIDDRDVYWVIRNDKQARQQLKDLREKASELIEFY